MADSTASSIPPLSDRSNTFLDPSAPTHRSPTPSRHTDSRRYLFPHLDSSEATPSENGSIFDAKHADFDDNRGEPPKKRARHKKRSHSCSLSEEQWLPGSPNGPGVAVRFINRPDATPLTTIVEQKSIPTLRSARSLAAVAHLTSSKRANHFAEGTEQKESRRDHAGRRQTALTIDEATLRELHEIIGNQVPAGKNISSASGSNCVNDVQDPTRPISPPHSPPFRAQTPCGLPRWPGDLPASLQTPRRRVSRARSFGNAVRDFFRGPREELQGRNHSNHTVLGGVRERLQPPYANPSDHHTGLAFWRPPTSAHGTSILPGCHVTEPDVREVTAETGSPCDPPAPEREPGTRSRLHRRNEKRDRESSQREPLQPQDRQGPVQAPMSGSAPPNVAQAGHSQASRRSSTPTSQPQKRPPFGDVGPTDSPNSVYSTPTRTGRDFNHPLIPAPLFASPPHSRRDLDPRVPVSPYDRLAHVLNAGQQSSGDTASPNLRKRARHAAASRDTSSGVPTYRPGGAGLRNVDANCADMSPRIISTASNTPASTCASTAATSSKDPHSSLGSVQDSCARGSLPSSVSSTIPGTPVFPQPQSQPQTKQSKFEHEPCASIYSAGLTVIRSAALPALLPIAAAEGIVRPRPLPRPVTLPLTDAELNAPPRKSRHHRRSSSAASISASTRAMRASDSSVSYHTAAQMPRTSGPHDSSACGSDALAPLSLDQVLAAGTTPHAPVPREDSMDIKRNRWSSESNTDGEKGTGEALGWLLRVCFCQPVGGIEDWESGGGNARRLRRLHRSVKQGSDVRRLGAQQDLAAG